MSGSLSVRGLAVRFNGTDALRGIDLDVASSEVVAVLGPSGSGKTTLLRAIAGLQLPTAGAISLDGRDLAGVPPHRRGIGLMFQDHALFPHHDVTGNVAFGLRMLGVRGTEVVHRVDEMLQLVGLAGFGARRIQTLSGGEQQRVALARALAPRPSVLLLDEPLGALDRLLRERLVTELRSLFTELGLTVVAVTHDHREAFSLADRVAVMDDGGILQCGTPITVWTTPRTRRVAELLGFANVVDVVVAAGRAETPWGPVAVSAADGAATLLIRPTGVRLPPAGAGPRGRVLSAAFAGERTTVAMAVADAPQLEASVATASAPRPGDEVAVVLDAGEVVVLGE